jgi:hypothetical protein
MYSFNELFRHVPEVTSLEVIDLMDFVVEVSARSKDGGDSNIHISANTVASVLKKLNSLTKK